MRGWSTVKLDNSRIAGFYLLKGTAFTSDACFSTGHITKASIVSRQYTNMTI